MKCELKESLDVVCPYKAIAGFYCYHKNNRNGYRKKTICRYKNNPSKCPLFKDWESNLSTVNNSVKIKRL